MATLATVVLIVAGVFAAGAFIAVEFRRWLEFQDSNGD